MSDGWCPFASRVESPNFGYPRGTHDQLVNPLAVVDHIMCGTMSGCRSWFRDPNSWASATFGVGKNGDIDQYISLNDCAWANGAVNKPYAIAAPVYTGQNPNMVTWSIEHEGWPQDIWTEAMYQADLKLKRWLWQRKSGLLLLGHCHIDSVTRSGCPGPNWPRDRLLRDLKEGDMSGFSQVQLNEMKAIIDKAIADAADDKRKWDNIEMAARGAVSTPILKTFLSAITGHWENLAANIGEIQAEATRWHRWPGT